MPRLTFLRIFFFLPESVLLVCVAISRSGPVFLGGFGGTMPPKSSRVVGTPGLNPAAQIRTSAIKGGRNESVPHVLDALLAGNRFLAAFACAGVGPRPLTANGEILAVPSAA